MPLLPNKILAKALLDKNTPAYANKSTWGPYDFEKDIYPQARMAFPDYNKLYPLNEDLTKNFAKDYYKKDSRLLEKIFGKQPDQTTGARQTEASTPIPRIQLPKIPSNLRSVALRAGSIFSISFQRNIGKYMTFGRVVALAGGIAAGVATGGNPLAIAAGAGAGLLGSSYLSSPEGKAFMQNIGRGNVNSSQRNSPFRRSKKSWFKGGRLIFTSSILAFFLLMFFGGFLAPFGAPIALPTGETSPISETSTNLAISLAGPSGCTDNCKADNNQEITYQISLTYNGADSADIEVFGSLPDGVILSRAVSEKWSPSSKNFSQVITGIASKETKRLSLTFKPENKTDFWTNHSVGATLIKLNPSTSNACQSKYASVIAKNPDKANFGDPKCNFSKDDLYKALKQQDPANADFWYFKVVPCESSYNPNEYYRCTANGNNCTPDPDGAWGLFQMGRGKNGNFDHGDVIWPEQISNAVNYNKTKLQPERLSIGEYWACAR